MKYPFRAFLYTDGSCRLPFRPAFPLPSLTGHVYCGRSARHIYYDIFRQVMSAGNPSGPDRREKKEKTGKKSAGEKCPTCPKRHICAAAAGFRRQKRKKRKKAGFPYLKLTRKSAIIYTYVLTAPECRSMERAAEFIPYESGMIRNLN